MTFRNTLAAAASALALSLGAAPALIATTQPAAAQTESGYSAEQIDAFVEALGAVNALHASFSERLAAATTEAEQTEIVEEGNAAIAAAIDEIEGMDIELYASILDRAGTDPTLNEEIVQRIEATQGG